MTDPAAALADAAIVRRIEATGWSTVLLGVLCVLLAGVQAAVPILFDRMSAMFEGDDSLRGMREALSAGAGISAVVNGLFGVALIVIGFAVTRRARWAHAALTASGWASIVVLAILAKPSLAPFFALAGDAAAPGRGMLLASFGLLVLQVGAVLWFLRFWRRPEVRAAFR